MIVLDRKDHAILEALQRDSRQTLQQLAGALSIRATMAEKIPVLKTSAINGEGVPKLIETLNQLGGKVRTQEPLSRRRRRARYLIARAASDIVANRIKAGGKSSLDTLADSVLSGTMTPHAAASRLLED